MLIKSVSCEWTSRIGARWKDITVGDDCDNIRGMTSSSTFCMVSTMQLIRKDTKLTEWFAPRFSMDGWKRKNIP